jgi:translation initiation factor 6
MNMNFIGLFTAGNSNGVIVPELAAGITLDIQVNVIKSRSTCLGNLVLCNDTGAIVSPLLKKNAPDISKALGVPVEIGTIAGLNIVGSCGLSTNKGCLVHPGITKEEAQLIEKVLGVSVEKGTLNRGSPYVGACAIANSKGALVSQLTMPAELLRIEEALG